MAREFLADLPIDATLVGPEMRVLGDCIDDDWLQRCSSHFRDVIAADLAAALDKCQDKFLWWRSLERAVLRLAASKGLIRLNELAFTAERTEMPFAHRFTNPHGHKP